MSSRKLDELASDVDDASTIAEEVQAEPDADDREEKMDELHNTLEHATDTLNALEDKDE